MSPGSLRADAERNRRQLLDAARAVFAARGLDAPLDDIARRARVGNATLYRRFPRRRDLVGAVFVEPLREVVATARAALTEQDPWRAFASHLSYLCELQSRDRALAELLTARMSEVDELDDLRDIAFDCLVELVDRARAAGAVRPDVDHADVVLILMANAGLVERIAASAPDAWRRHLSYVLDGLRPTGAPAVTTPAPRLAEPLPG
ncbi:TetR family transcriptional regulator [Asanoa sp. WMMD1127]|uniref:TetR/AcrR family transcriptional regulator n=1 Tax=Asanoa sp. WMMD1127 TaxID=3016107 RepID=UPI002417F74B|nr:TetR family transcriptional regulator [Asanoa sp. WMMD1127]MDG4826718.1 TetR family transcriptional regulator [Asanoa sp. WMMD1127]